MDCLEDRRKKELPEMRRLLVKDQNVRGSFR